MTIPDQAALIEALTPAQVMGLTAFREAEARLELGKGWIANPVDAMLDVLSVIHNRAQRPKWQALGHKGLCTNGEFSCWIKAGGLSNWQELMRLAQCLIDGRPVPEPLRICIEAADACLAGRLEDTVGSATHYYAPMSMVPAGRVPTWARTGVQTCERFGHKFYKGVK